jgi:hypothetical protein
MSRELGYLEGGREMFRSLRKPSQGILSELPHSDITVFSHLLYFIP